MNILLFSMQHCTTMSWPSHQSASLPPLTVEDVEHFFEEERKTFSNLKSSTVGAYFRRIVSTSKHSSQTNFFQQLGKRMKESFGSFAKSSDILEQQQKQPNQMRAQVTFSFIFYFFPSFPTSTFQNL